jgi:hypothetical protein
MARQRAAGGAGGASNTAGSDHQGAALAKLLVLAGRDHRFIQPVTQMERALKSGAVRGDAMSALEAVLESEDHSADFISKPLFASLRHAVDEHS